MNPCQAFGKSRTKNGKGASNANWKGGKSLWPFGNSRGPNFQEQSEKARERDEQTCQQCGQTEAELGRRLDVHHKIPFENFPDWREANDLSNLVSLCQPCHKRLEAQIEERQMVLPLYAHRPAGVQPFLKAPRRRQPASTAVDRLLAELKAYCDQGRGRRGQVARFLGIDRSAVSDWFNPDKSRLPTAEQALAIQEFLKKHRRSRKPSTGE